MAQAESAPSTPVRSLAHLVPVTVSPASQLAQIETSVYNHSMRCAMMRGHALRLLAVVVVVCGLVPVAHAQWGRWGGVGEGNLPPRFPPSSFPDRDFTFCKLMYDSVRYEELGMGWSTDYPYAGINLMIRYSELTTGRVSLDTRREPNHWVVRLTDDALFNCPFMMAADVGTIGFNPEEAQRLRAYLLKGGFLWVDDFWGSRAWQHWTSEIGKVLPSGQYPVIDVPTGSSRLSGSDTRDVGSSDHGDPVLARCRWADDVGTGHRQRRAALPRHRRRPRQVPCRDDAQHRHC